MAVIRQQTQVFNKPIGVVRAEAGGQEVANAISRAAQTYSDRMYKRAAEEAKEAGQEKALATATSDIAALDPNTNKPVVYNPPAQFGTIAAAAYQDIIDRRFEDSIALELQTRGAEFADTSSSAAQYRERMAQYVDQMYGAEGEDTFYKRYVQEAGTAYVEKTFSALRKKEVDAIRARAKKESKLADALAVIEIQNALAAGQITPELEKKIEELNANALTGYLAGANTIADVTQANDFVMGFNALKANSELAKIYMSADDVKQAQIKQALRDPVNADDYIADPTLRGFIQSSLRGKATSSQIVSALEANEKDLNDIAEARDLDFVESNPITAGMSFPEVDTLYKGQSPETRSQAFEDLFILNIDPELTSESMDLLVNELQKPKQLIDESVFPEEVRGIISSMGQDDISDLAENLKGRQSALSGVKTQELNESLERTALIIEDLASARDFKKVGRLYTDGIMSLSGISDPKKVRDKRRALNAEFVLKIRELVPSKNISLDRLKQINNAIIQGTYSQRDYNNDEANYGDLMEKAHDLAPSAISSHMTKLQEIRAQEIQDQVNRTTLESATEAANNGQPLNKTQRAALQASIYGEDIPTPQFLLTDPSFRSRAVQNSILDAEFIAIEQGLLSTNQETQIAAFDLFRQLQKVQQDTGPEIVDRNLILGKVDDETYNSANAAVIISSLSGDAPNVVMANMMAYSGSTDTVIRDGLGIQSMNDLFTDPDLKLTGFSSAAQEEFKAVLRYAVASDRPVNVETLKAMKKSYTSLMVEDDFVLGARVGDKSRYAVALAFGDTEAREALRYVVSEMADDPMLKPYLEDIGLAGRVMSSGGLNYENQVLASLQKYMKLDPIKETWVGDDSNKSYIVKILSTGGGYVTMEKDGFPIIISQSQFSEEETDERSLFSYNNALTAAVNSGNKRGTAKAGLEYLIKLDPEKYTDLESVRSIPRDDYFINDQLSDEEVQQIIEGMQRGQ